VIDPVGLSEAGWTRERAPIGGRVAGAVAIGQLERSRRGLRQHDSAVPGGTHTVVAEDGALLGRVRGERLDQRLNHQRQGLLELGERGERAGDVQADRVGAVVHRAQTGAACALVRGDLPLGVVGSAGIAHQLDRVRAAAIPERGEQARQPRSRWLSCRRGPRAAQRAGLTRRLGVKITG